MMPGLSILSSMDAGSPLSPLATQLLTQGLLGVTVLFLLFVIWYLWKEVKGERNRCSTFQTELVKLGGDIAKSNSDVAKALEERNRLTSEISATNARLGSAIEHLGSILELQHSHVVNAIREIKRG